MARALLAEGGQGLRSTPTAGAPSPPTGSVATALRHAERLLARAPALALEQVDEVLGVVGPDARALRIKGLAQQALGRPAEAVASLRAASAADPALPGVWLALGDILAATDERQAADEAYRHHVEAAVGDVDLMQAAEDLADDRLDFAEARLRQRLRSQPTDIAAIRMLGEVAARLGRLADAQALFARALEIAPAFLAARHNHAVILYRQGQGGAALAEVERLRALRPQEAAYRILHAAVLALVGDYEASIVLYRAALAERDDQPKLWLSLGHALKTVGRPDDTVQAYRRCLALSPGLGEAWWSLANLKTARFTTAERTELEALAADRGNSDEDRLHLHYALGKAREDAGEDDAAFASYASGAAIQKRRLAYDADETSAQVTRATAVLTAELLSERGGVGCDAQDPIFVVGLPRSGSTLIEQILSSHSCVEGTVELAELPAIARRAGAMIDGAPFPEALSRLSDEDLAALGRDYLAHTRIHRRTDRPLFIDKMPNNWLHVGLIRLILPNATVIDARRHPLGAGFSAFKQHFARGQGFSYDLTDIGAYYRDYVALMDHFDRVAPGAVHRVIYEDMVEDTEGQVRRLLDHCGLAFEPACLRFYETARAVRTASSEQVRRPIYREGLDQWRRFERHLDPLKAALGPALAGWRGAANG